ncbi:probable WRKY transcription factor 70 [Vigna unguiculata]|uniref:probable WRKY transcription factor 70 n=1 Tax=Vigna unguiculata TaxID=3917 RepID=UPI0010164B39|nr:probable WRKY transcription factor 70 [Vigna unguiculata]
MNKRVITELLLGLDHATQLKFLLQNPVGPDGSVAAKELVTNVQRSFAQTLSMLTSSQPARGEDEVAQNLLISGEDASQVASIDPRSEDSTESRKRSLPLAKDRRGSYKRRKTEQTWTIVSHTIDDNRAWRKYGQKDILNSQFPRSYFRCTRKYEQGCKATKQVQRLEENPDMYNITYIGFHTCKDSLKAPQMVTCSETWDSFLENSHEDLNVPNEEQQHECPPMRSQSPIVKQECLNDETDPSDLTDANLWSDLKDFELSNDKPALKISDAFMNLLSEFGHEF